MAATLDASRASPQRLFALKHGDTFMVADAYGDIVGDGDGLFHDDTRILSRLRADAGRQHAVPARRRGQPGQRLLHRAI